MHIFINIIKIIGLFIVLFLGYYTLSYMLILWILKCLQMTQGGGWAIAFVLAIGIAPFLAIVTIFIIRKNSTH